MPAGVVRHADLLERNHGACPDEEPITKLLFNRFDALGGILPRFRGGLIVGDFHQADTTLFEGMSEADQIFRRKPAYNCDDFTFLYILQRCHIGSPLQKCQSLTSKVTVTLAVTEILAAWTTVPPTALASMAS